MPSTYYLVINNPKDHGVDAFYARFLRSIPMGVEKILESAGYMAQDQGWADFNPDRDDLTKIEDDAQNMRRCHFSLLGFKNEKQILALDTRYFQHENENMIVPCAAFADKLSLKTVYSHPSADVKKIGFQRSGDIEKIIDFYKTLRDDDVAQAQAAHHISKSKTLQEKLTSRGVLGLLNGKRMIKEGTQMKTSVEIPDLGYILSTMTRELPSAWVDFDKKIPSPYSEQSEEQRK